MADRHERSHEQIADELAAFCKELSTLGVPVPAGNRILRLEQTLRRAQNGTWRKDESAFERLVRAVLDGTQIADIAACARTAVAQEPRWNARLSDLVSGHEYPGGARGIIRLPWTPAVATKTNTMETPFDHFPEQQAQFWMLEHDFEEGGLREGMFASPTKPADQPRDKQFELLVASELERRGLPALLEEPDVVVRQESEVLGIPAKRVRSFKKFDDRLLEAAEQMERHGTPGVIAIDVTLAVGLHRKVVVLGDIERHSSLHQVFGEVLRAKAGQSHLR